MVRRLFGSGVGPGRTIGLFLIAGLAAGPALADPIPDDAGSRVRTEQPILLSPDQIQVLHVTPKGVLPPDQGVNPQICNQVFKHTDANFDGGSYVLQQGMVSTEGFAATYTVPASDFPIRHNLTEVLFAQSNSSATVTQWSILVYDGLPSNGTLVAVWSSDDVLLPHIRMPAGTQGVLLQFSVDPGDPDQIQVDDVNGTHQFSVVIRIDQLNNQPPNPCTNPPSPSSNAFMCTDTSGLQQAANNWLLGLNCGPFGCPANGGYARFSALPALCRPSGDWIARTTWSSISCTPGVGACCLPNGTCQVLSTQQCADQNGVYQGDGVSCGQTNCPQPTGACCFTNGFCVPNLTSSQCTGAGGTWAGANTACGANNTCPQGACCLPSGDCVFVTAGECSNLAGTFRGVGVACAGANCPQPEGACCFSNGFCISLTEASCAGAGGIWGGAFTTCIDNNQNGQADICEQGCAADFNGDNQVDFFDYLDFAQAFDAEDESADFNHDNQVDFFDYLDFAQAFDEGC
jgi:hypothetical protein